MPAAPSLETRLAGLERRLRPLEQNSLQRKLERLKADDGIVLDPDEVTFLKDLSPAQVDGYIARVKSRFSRTAADRPDANGVSERERDLAIDLASNRGIPFGDALAEIRSSRSKARLGRPEAPRPCTQREMEQAINLASEKGLNRFDEALKLVRKSG